jgi:hypothetical protein
MSDRRPKDSGGWTTTTKCPRKSWAKKAASKSSFIQLQNDNYSNDMQKFEKGKRGSEKLFPLFPFLNLFYLLFIFLFYEMQKWGKTNMQWKRRKENGGFGGERKNSNANGGRRMEKKMG